MMETVLPFFFFLVCGGVVFLGAFFQRFCLCSCSFKGEISCLKNIVCV